MQGNSNQWSQNETPHFSRMIYEDSLRPENSSFFYGNNQHGMVDRYCNIENQRQSYSEFQQFSPPGYGFNNAFRNQFLQQINDYIEPTYHTYANTGPQTTNLPNSALMKCHIPPPPPPLEETHTQSYNLSETPDSTLPSIKVVKNDYNQHFIDTGERPQNFIRDHQPSLRFTEYPKLARLIHLKDEYHKKRAHPPMHIREDLRRFNWSTLNTLFDVILIDPPWREYAERAASLGAVVSEQLTPWTFEDMLQYLKIDKISETPSFCFLWCGTSHLDEGRQLLQEWGFRRCEDICWCKTNVVSTKAGNRHFEIMDERSLFQRTTEHCLMGVKGLVKRSADTFLIHSNIDTDVIIGEEPTDTQENSSASTYKPVELHEMIERFALGRKKLELFGLDRNIRPGWLTIGQEISASNYDPVKYLSWMAEAPESDNVSNSSNTPYDKIYTDYRGGRYVGSTSEIDQLRPKSPPRSTTRYNNPS